MVLNSIIHFALLAISIFCFQNTLTLAEKKSYIVYLGIHPHGLAPTEQDAEVATQSHYELLGSVLGSYEKAKESVQYSYNKYINGFAAKLSEEEAERVQRSSNVVSVFENQMLELHTTRSWEFLGLEKNDNTVPSNSLWNLTNYGQGITIGTLDSGVWPESESFSDKGELGPVPSKWKGTCMKGSDPTFKCNNKLIGARYFLSDSANIQVNKSTISPRDTAGHGTHTLSTVGGSFVNGANLFGYGTGIAKGGSPKARVAAYKVCWDTIYGQLGCLTSDILAGFEAAIDDGVDVLSVSLGGVMRAGYKYTTDGLAIGAFHAVRQGITVVASAGNNGPGPGSVLNTAPWLFTVGASTSDRAISNRVYLGNLSMHFKGSTGGPNKMLPKRVFHPLVNGASCSNSSSSDDSRFCLEGSLDSKKVKGAIVVCLKGKNGKVLKGQAVKLAGGVGMIIVNDDSTSDIISSDPHFLPTIQVYYKDGIAIQNYINNTTNPTAYISSGKTELGVKPAPVMAPFSSRGPSRTYPQILKPDITAPGVSTLAAYTGAKSVTGLIYDNRIVNYTFLSGTSMSCPHVSGVVGLLKSLHPDWSPAAIRSAIMTTARVDDNNGSQQLLDYDKQQATPFAYGAGHISPNDAADPGLVYNLTESDYLDFLCSLFYTEQELKVLSPNAHKCKNSKSILDFNYPSITISNFTTSTTLTRTVTNVGKASTYEAQIQAPAGVNVTVVPSTLKFNHTGEELLFTMKFVTVGKNPSTNSSSPNYVFGSLTWNDGTHKVRSPIVVERV